MRIRCPNCRTKIDIPEAYEGKEIRCLKCDAWLIATKHPTLISAQIEPPINHEVAIKSPPPVPVEVKPVTISIRQKLKPYRKPLFALFGIILTTSTVALYYGYLRGRKAGFDEGSSAVLYIVDSLSNNSPRENPSTYPDHVPESPNGKIKSLGWKIIEKTDDYYKVSWQAKFESWKTHKALVKVNFYDKDWFKIADAYVSYYYQDFSAGTEYTLTDIAVLDPTVAEKIAHIGLEIITSPF